MNRMIVVAGRRVAVRVTGSQEPAVVMLSSAGGGHEQWEQLRALLDDALCVSYGRPGIDGSDPLPPDLQGVPRTASWAADHLHALLQAARIPPPYVLVGCSIGGWIADQFTAAWPDEVAGLVQVDATSITPIPRAHRDEIFDDADHGGITFSWPATVAELVAGPPPVPRRAVVVSKAFGSVPLEVVERVWRPLTPSEVDHGWRACQVEWADRLHAVHIAADFAGHHVQIDQPDLVAFAVRRVIAAAHADTDLALDPADVATAGGTLLSSP